MNLKTLLKENWNRFKYWWTIGCIHCMYDLELKMLLKEIEHYEKYFKEVYEIFKDFDDEE